MIHNFRSTTNTFTVGDLICAEAGVALAIWDWFWYEDPELTHEFGDPRRYSVQRKIDESAEAKIQAQRDRKSAPRRSLEAIIEAGNYQIAEMKRLAYEAELIIEKRRLDMQNEANRIRCMEARIERNRRGGRR